MDDIIVLILTLVFIAAGIFGQMKKRQLPPEQPGEAIPGRQNFWDPFEEEQEEPIGVTEHLQPVKEVAKEDRFHTSASMMKREFPKKVAEIKPEKPKPAIAQLKKFPLKKAVIYSEILNRKYF